MNIDDVELALEVIKERLSELENGDIKVIETCDPTINERYIASQKLLDSCNKLYDEMRDLNATINYRINTINDSQKEIEKMLNDMVLIAAKLCDFLSLPKTNLRKNYDKISVKFGGQLANLFNLEEINFKKEG